MVVKFIVDTNYKGKFYKKGTIINETLKESDLNRLIKNRIVVKEGEHAEVVLEKTNYNSMSAKELYDVCIESGIDVEPKKKKDYYLEKLGV